MNKKGFTLVELIIVIAVMAILAAIVIPRMTGITQSFKEKADERVCENYARELEIMYQMGETVDGDGTAGAPITSYGLVSDVITNVETPESMTGNYYFVYNGTNTVTVYVSNTAPTSAAVPAGVVNASRDNAVEIE
ncbi:MAG: type II secretion system protein [Clostridia bacterium]|nr:type II secretion system protein [Clostridia bacterium]